MRESPPHEGARLLEVLGLTGLVVTQPVLEVFQNGADVFVIRDAGPFVIVAFAVIVALVPALVLWGVGALIGLASQGARDAAHRLTIAVLGGLLAAMIVDDLFDPPRAVPVVVLVATPFAVDWLVRRFAAVSLLLRYVATGSLLFVGVFLLASPVTDLLRSGDVDAAEVDVTRPAPVVMIVLDELPTVSLLDGEGAVDAGRFPALASLASDATWYRNHSTVAPLTPGAVPALLSGRLPEGPEDAPVAAVHPDTLFTLLGDSYDVHASETLTDLCPPSVCRDRDEASPVSSLRSLLDTAADVEKTMLSFGSEPAPVGFTVSDLPSDPDAPDRLSTFAASLGPADGDRPRLDYVHALVPHQPYDYLPSGEAYDAPDPPAGLGFFSLWENQGAADVGRQRHLLQLELADRLVGDVLDRLRELGTYDESLVVVTADHGVAFTPASPLRGVDAQNFPEIMWTPFFVKPPGQTEPEVVDDPMQSIDDLGVIADVLGVEIPWEHGTPADADPEDRLLLDWSFHGIHPEDGDFLTFDGAEGFDSVLAHEPLGVPGDAPLGLYRTGPDASLVGQPAPDGETVAATVETAGAYVAGRLPSGDTDRLVLVVDGTVVASPAIVGDQFFAMIPDRWRPTETEDVTVLRVVED